MSRQLCEGLSGEDMVVQSMPDCSPTKWHLAHTTWFFETFILSQAPFDKPLFDASFPYLFNSYYDSLGDRHARPARGMLTRPSLDQVLAFRQHVDQLILAVLEEDVPKSVLTVLETGLHHEMQHQELMLTDILHLFSLNPTCPALKKSEQSNRQSAAGQQPSSVSHLGGELAIIGHDQEHSNDSFAYDNEQPAHKYWLPAYAINNGLVSNAQWQAFIEDGGYDDPLLWLSDGWHYKQSAQWCSPLYWRKIEGTWYTFGLNGLVSLNPHAPVSHVSFYEADAFARWAGKRLPTEFEWEVFALQQDAEQSIASANVMESYHWQAQAPLAGAEFANPFGDVWEWTASPYIAYPGFRPEQGALGEYNGKFMANQWVLRGGSCVTPRAQIRPTYRNFFHAHQRWQFSGVRLASDN